MAERVLMLFWWTQVLLIFWWNQVWCFFGGIKFCWWFATAAFNSSHPSTSLVGTKRNFLQNLSMRQSKKVAFSNTSQTLKWDSKFWQIRKVWDFIRELKFYTTRNQGNEQRMFDKIPLADNCQRYHKLCIIAIVIAREISKNGFHECLINCLGISIVEGANYAK